jgi:nucleoside-diphosphate-sugar epimerase
MKLIFGCGYLGQRTAKLWQDQGETVSVVTRSSDRAAELTQLGYQALVADVTQPQTLSNLPAADTVLFAVGFDRNSKDSINEVYAGGVKNALAALPITVQQFIYNSTTGVYGPAGGDWVDENTSPNPGRDGGHASLAAEQLLADHPLGNHAAVLRLGGIYGPGRIPYLAQLRAGQPIAAPSQGWVNLIHVDDAAQITLATDRWLTNQPNASSRHIFCVTDGQPVLRANYYREVARRIAAPEPTFTAPTSPAAARALADKRVRNEKITQTLNQPLTYPSYREGLAAIL